MTIEEMIADAGMTPASVKLWASQTMFDGNPSKHFKPGMNMRQKLSVGDLCLLVKYSSTPDIGVIVLSCSNETCKLSVIETGEEIFHRTDGLLILAKSSETDNITDEQWSMIMTADESRRIYVPIRQEREAKIQFAIAVSKLL